jgi:hypothetical protein
MINIKKKWKNVKKNLIFQTKKKNDKEELKNRLHQQWSRNRVAKDKKNIFGKNKISFFITIIILLFIVFLIYFIFVKLTKLAGQI